MKVLKDIIAAKESNIGHNKQILEVVAQKEV